MDAGSIYLIAWARPDDAFHAAAFHNLSNRIQGRRPRVGYIGAANGDNPSWGQGLIRALEERFSVEVELIRTLSEADRPEVLAAIERADLLYLGGGDVCQLIRTLRARNLERSIADRLAAGADLLGVSAGAVAMGAYWIEYPDPIPDPPVPFDGGALLPGLQLVDFVLDVHSEEDDWPELRQCMGLLARDRAERGWSGYGIPRGGAIVVNGNVLREIGNSSTVLTAA